MRRLQAMEHDCLTHLTPFKLGAQSFARWQRSLVPGGLLPRRLANGYIVFDGIEFDITERKLHEQEIHHPNTQLEQRVQERTAQLQATLERLQQTRKRCKAKNALVERFGRRGGA